MLPFLQGCHFSNAWMVIDSLVDSTVRVICITSVILAMLNKSLSWWFEKLLKPDSLFDDLGHFMEV